eukprot:Phypoly_transcript_04072.p1 GENE.Phypoly_transcript_04072~~Phypoly_transcript_04072.p1  ORF type:complete len:740 (+),score=180.96 Phypoly_transcript_04072:305-2221(+)
MAKQIETLFSAFLHDVPKEPAPSPSLNTTATTTTTTTTTTTSTTESTPTTTNSSSPTIEKKSDSTGDSTLPASATPPDAGSAAPPPSPVDGSHANPPATTTTENEKQMDVSDQEKFEKVENEIFLISETVQYMQHVLPPTSQRTLECLGKVTDQYVKGWACIENKADLRQKYCVVLDKIGGWWLDEFLLFPELSLAEKEKWLNTYLRNWTRADGQSSGIENETNSSMRVVASRRPTPPPSPPEGPIDSSVDYDEYIARAYQQKYEAEHARSVGNRAESSDSMEDYYLAASIQREEQEELENRRIMSEIEKACAETEAKALGGDQDNAEMGDGQAKPAEEGAGGGEGMKDEEGMGEGSSEAPPHALVKDESMIEENKTETTQNFENSTPTVNNAMATNDTNASNDNNNNTHTTSKTESPHVNTTTPFSVHVTNPGPFQYDPDDGKPRAFGHTKEDLDMPSAAYAAAAAERYKNGNYSNSSKNSKNSRRNYDDEDEEDELPPGVGTGIPDIKEWFSKQDEDDRSRRMKRGRSADDLDDDSDSEDDEVQRANQWRAKDKIQNDRFDLLSTTWRIIKNMQIVGSMRFELYKKCGMYEECVKIANALNDREKIMDSRVLARATRGPEKNDDELEKAMKSMLHL